MELNNALAGLLERYRSYGAGRFIKMELSFTTFKIIGKAFGV
jgi:hypothetical protein